MRQLSALQTVERIHLSPVSLAPPSRPQRWIDERRALSDSRPSDVQNLLVGCRSLASSHRRRHAAVGTQKTGSRCPDAVASQAAHKDRQVVTFHL